MSDEKSEVMQTKTFLANVKSVGDESTGGFTAYASIFGNKDSYGDVVVKGAFSDTVKESDGVFPVYWSHRMDDPMMNIGITTSAKEDETGLLVEARLDTDSPVGAHVHKLLKQGRVKQMSFAYDIEKSSDINGGPFEKDGYRELSKLKLHEVSVVPIGANQETSILAVKSAALKSDETQGGTVEEETTTTENEETSTDKVSVDKQALQDVIDALTVLLESEESESNEEADEDQDEDNDQTGDGASEDSSPGKSRGNPDSILATIKALTIR